MDIKNTAAAFALALVLTVSAVPAYAEADNVNIDREQVTLVTEASETEYNIQIDTENVSITEADDTGDIEVNYAPIDEPIPDTGRDEVRPVIVIGTFAAALVSFVTTALISKKERKISRGKASDCC